MSAAKEKYVTCECCFLQLKIKISDWTKKICPVFCIRSPSHFRLFILYSEYFA